MSDLPAGHIIYQGREYVAASLFEAACKHVREQGDYHNRLVGTLNAVGEEHRQVREQVARLQQERDDARTELEECRRKTMAMRRAVYGAAEGL